MAVPSPNILFTLFIIFFTLSALYHRSIIPSGPTQPSVFSRYAADILVPSTNDTFLSRPAAFGVMFEEVLAAELISAWDGLACSPPADTAPFRGRVVLVQRGQCTFADKVRLAQQIGGIA